MTRVTRHVVLPSLVPALFFAVASMPRETLGCRNQALAVVAIAFASVLGALAVTIVGATKRLRRDPEAWWWLGTTLLLVIAPVALLLLA